MLFGVIVTYGRREAFFLKSLRSAFSSGIDKAVVVDNGSHWNVQAGIGDEYASKVDVVRLKQNLGSAPGFKAGIARAMELGAQYIILLDDDLLGTRESLAHMRECLERAARQYGLDKSMVVGYRDTHMRGLLRAIAENRPTMATPHLLRFGVSRLPSNLWSLVVQAPPSEKGGSTIRTGHPGGLHRVDFAPYGGLLFHRSVADTIGLPDQDFVLYWDDIDWTYRLKKHGGAVFVDADAPLEEMEVSQFFRRRYGSRLHSLLLRESGPRDSSIFYEVRNTIYFACHSAGTDVRWPRLRSRLLLAATLVLSMILRRKQRFLTIREAIDDGIAGRLGFRPDHPLD